MKNLIFIFCIVLLAGCNMFRPDTRSDLTRYEIFVEVDGKPYKITRTIQTWITYGFDTNQGSSQGKRSEYEIFGEKIHDNQAIVFQYDYRHTSKPSNWNIDEREGSKTLTDLEHLKTQYKILLLDHYINPQVIEMYDSKEAFNSSKSRIKVTKIIQTHVPKIPFWPFQGDGRDRYYDFDLKERPYFSIDSRYNFETRHYFERQISGKTINEIILKFPEIKPQGIYRLKSYYVLDENGKYISKPDRYHPTRQIIDMINEHSSCDAVFSCNTFSGVKKHNGWNMIDEESLPKKIYRAHHQEKRNRFDTTFYYEFQLENKKITIVNDPLYTNSFIDFDSKTFYGLSYQFYSTKIQKK